MQIHMKLKKTFLIFLIGTFIVCLLSNCNNSRAIVFVDSGMVNDSVNFYIYHNTTFSHEGSESYFAIGKSFCDVYNDTTKTFAETIGFAQIDTITSGKIKIATQFGITYHNHPKGISIETIELKPMDEIKAKLNYLFIDTCRK